MFRLKFWPLRPWGTIDISLKLDEIDDIPRLLTADVSRRYGVKFTHVISDKDNVRYLRVCVAGDLDVYTWTACGRHFKWVVEILDNYHDICDRRLYGANDLEDYSIIDRISVEDDALVNRLLAVVSKQIVNSTAGPSPWTSRPHR